MSDFTYFDDIGATVDEVASGAILSRTLLKNAHVRTIMFKFAPGEELSEHTSAMPAVLHVLKGEGQITLGEEKVSAGAGFWAYMTPHLPHSIEAETELTMLLLLLPGGSS
jgi:quercetin dioxygenase-like cupin family protein